MAKVWMRLDSIPTSKFMGQVVIPLVKELGKQGIRANLEATRNEILNHEGFLDYALFPGGELTFYFTTGPTHDTSTGTVFSERFAMATVSKIPNGYSITEDHVLAALRGFAQSLPDRGIYDASSKIYEGDSFGGRAKVSVATSGASSSASGSSSSGGCYVATAVYGGYDMPPVRVLRRFRDQTMSASRVGRQLVRAYYRVSPGLVRRFSGRSWFTKLLRPSSTDSRDCFNPSATQTPPTTM